MIDDVTPPRPRQRPKPKRIEPLPKPVGPSIHQLAEAEDLAFKLPEQAAITPTSDRAEAAPAEPAKQKWYKRLRPHSRKQWILSSVLAVLLTFGLGAGWTLTHHKRTIQAATPKKSITTKVVKPVVIYSTLTGLPVADASVNKRTVTGVMIENSLDARPQSGLGEAGVVFEAVAEGGVTRFLALFQDTAPTNVGPIRSARPYYVSWALGFDAAYAHVGGSPDALADITAWGVHDMNQFYNGGSYHRTADRAAPHNVYTSIDTLNQLEAAKGYTSTYTGFPRGKEAPYKAPAAATSTATTTQPPTATDTRTPATSMKFALSGPTYDPSYEYVAATNSYNRSEAGEPHIDANTKKQISPQVVIAMVVPLARGALDSSGAYYSNYTVVGSGQAYIFQNGTITTGTWTKTANNAQLSFTDATGTAIPLNPGQTWISAVSATNQVTYK